MCMYTYIHICICINKTNTYMYKYIYIHMYICCGAGCLRLGPRTWRLLQVVLKAVEENGGALEYAAEEFEAESSFDHRAQYYLQPESIVWYSRVE